MYYILKIDYRYNRPSVSLFRSSVVPFQTHNRSACVAEFPCACPSNLQLRFAIRVWTSDQSIGTHPVMSVCHSLLCCQQWEHSRFIHVSTSDSISWWNIKNPYIPRLYMLIPWPGGKYNISPSNVKWSPLFAPQRILSPSGHTTSTRRSYNVKLSFILLVEAMVVRKWLHLIAYVMDWVAQTVKACVSYYVLVIESQTDRFIPLFSKIIKADRTLWSPLR